MLNTRAADEPTVMYAASLVSLGVKANLRRRKFIVLVALHEISEIF